MIRLAIAGAGGRMGKRVYALAHADERFDVVAALDAQDLPIIGQDMGELAGVGRTKLPLQDHTNTDFDVLIEFAVADATQRWLEFCLTKGKAMVIGTTGHNDKQLGAIEAAATKIPLLKAANMSVGVNVLLQLVARAAKALGDAYDIEIVEAHHRFKADAPSGTAYALLDAIVDATGRDKTKDVVHGRHGQTGQRPEKQIGMHALRVGDTVGEHEVHFGTLGETITIKHSAHSRDIFVTGALRAAAWLATKPAGHYTMFDVLGLKP